PCAASRTREEDRAWPESARGPPDRRADAAPRRAAADRVGAAPSDREPDRVAAESSEGSQDTDEERMHDAEMRGDPADDQAEITLDGRRDEDRDRPEVDEEILDAQRSGSQTGSVTRSLSRLKTTRTGIPNCIPPGGQRPM